jgi:hypothetical protein
MGYHYLRTDPEIFDSERLGEMKVLSEFRAAVDSSRSISVGIPCDTQRKSHATKPERFNE